MLRHTRNRLSLVLSPGSIWKEGEDSSVPSPLPILPSFHRSSPYSARHGTPLPRHPQLTQLLRRTLSMLSPSLQEGLGPQCPQALNLRPERTPARP